MASTMSRCFERVSRIEVNPNEAQAYGKLVWTLNRLSLGILKNFARVSFRFRRVENLQHKRIHFYTRTWCGNPTLSSFLHNPGSNISPSSHPRSKYRYMPMAKMYDHKAQ